jgi:hypothetical protein
MTTNVVMLRANVDNTESVIVHLTNPQLGEVQKYQYAGGFKRFSIDVLDEKNERSGSKFFKLNREMADREVTRFLKSNLIIK